MVVCVAMLMVVVVVVVLVCMLATCSCSHVCSQDARTLTTCRTLRVQVLRARGKKY